MRQVELFGIQIDSETGATLVVLREQDEPHRMLPIFVGPGEAASIAMAFADEPSPRPSSHDLMTTFIEEVGARLDAVEVTDLRDDTFLAALTISGPAGELRLDSRPSDAIALAVRVDAPLFVAEVVLAEAGAVLPELDEEAIDREVAEFRSQLDDVDLAELLEHLTDDSEPGVLPAGPDPDGTFAHGDGPEDGPSSDASSARKGTEMEPDEAKRTLGPKQHAATPDTASWDAREGSEVELIGDQEPLDEVDLVDERWAPGQPPPGMPVEEVLHVHPSQDAEQSVDDLDLDADTRDDLALAADEMLEDEDGGAS
jgi:bifunctional DNase/RNase